MACNCNKVNKAEIWKRHIAGIDASRIAAQLMVQSSLVRECIEEGDPDKVVVNGPFKARNKAAKQKINE
jgi:hypothetical protein